MIKKAREKDNLKGTWLNSKSKATKGFITHARPQATEEITVLVRKREFI